MTDCSNNIGHYIIEELIPGLLPVSGLGYSRADTGSVSDLADHFYFD